MVIEYRGVKYIFRECDVKGHTKDEVEALATERGSVIYEPNGFVWLLIPPLGYGREDRGD